MVGFGIDEFKDIRNDDGGDILVGRAWTAADLRRKSFQDLHKLWYVLYKERNVLLSKREKFRQVDTAVPKSDMNRHSSVKKSMASIKLVLAERSKLRLKFPELGLNSLDEQMIQTKKSER
jgi:large subunit ribosomal protein L47